MPSSGFRRKQAITTAGGAAGILVVVLAPRALPHFASLLPAGDDPACRLAFAAHWLLLPALTLLVGIFGVSGRRGLMPEAIDGARATTSHSLEINLRYNQNTLEQVVLAAIAWAGLALALPHARLSLIPLAAVLFAVGRLTFWIGYLVNPVARAFGMVLTALPTILALIWLTWRTVWH